MVDSNINNIMYIRYVTKPLNSHLDNSICVASKHLVWSTIS